MGHQLTASGARHELETRLAEALTNDDDLEALVAFIRDDLSYDPDNRSIVGSVLNDSEFDAWRDLMTAVRWDEPWPVDYDFREVRTLSGKLLARMELN